MADEARQFEIAVEEFTDAMAFAANWKANFFGASYRTRLAHAIDYARAAATRMEDAIKAERARVNIPLSAGQSDAGKK
jgi:hypothetical protein